jgi:hypothetical protein
MYVAAYIYICVSDQQLMHQQRIERQRQVFGFVCVGGEGGGGERGCGCASACVCACVCVCVRACGKQLRERAHTHARVQKQIHTSIQVCEHRAYTFMCLCVYTHRNTVCIHLCVYVIYI